MPIHLSEEEKKPQHCLLNVRKPFLSVSRAWTELRKYFNCKRNVKSHPSSYWKTYYQMLKPLKKKICDYPKVDHRSLFSKGWPSRITKDRVTRIVHSITEAHFIVSICNFRTEQCSVPLSVISTSQTRGEPDSDCSKAVQ